MPSPTIVLIPGLLCDASVWTGQLAALHAFGPIFLAKSTGRDSITGLAKAILESTSGPIAVAGHSLGGRIAIEVARLAPGRVARLAIMSTGHHGTQPGEEAARMNLVEIARKDGMDAMAAKWLPPMMHPDFLKDEALMADLVAMVCRSNPEKFCIQQKALLNRPDATGVLPTIECPTHVIGARFDAWSPLEQHEEIAALVPDAKLTVIEDAGHMCTVERPDTVAAALVAWMTA